MVHCIKTGRGLHHFGILKCNVGVLQTVRYACLCVIDINDDILIAVPSLNSLLVSKLQCRSAVLVLNIVPAAYKFGTLVAVRDVADNVQYISVPNYTTFRLIPVCRR